MGFLNPNFDSCARTRNILGAKVVNQSSDKEEEGDYLNAMEDPPAIGKCIGFSTKGRSECRKAV